MGEHYLDGLKGLVNSKAPEDWNFAERRQVIRLECRYDVEWRTAPDQRPFNATVTDLGLKGMMLQTPHLLKSGETILVRFFDTDKLSDTVRCSVLWTRSRPRDRELCAGLIYADGAMTDSWPSRLLEQLGFHGEKIHQRRRFIRTECAVPVEIELSSSGVLFARLNNLGVGGALIEATWPLSEGEESMELRIGPFEGLSRLSLQANPTRSRAEGGRYLHGVEFSRLDAVQMRGLARYLFHMLRHHWAE